MVAASYGILEFVVTLQQMLAYSAPFSRNRAYAQVTMVHI